MTLDQDHNRGACGNHGPWPGSSDTPGGSTVLDSEVSVFPGHSLVLDIRVMLHLYRLASDLWRACLSKRMRIAVRPMSGDPSGRQG